MEWSPQTRALVRLACEEDLGAAGDITTALLAAPDAEVAARIVAREAGILCGLALADLIGETFAQRLSGAPALRPAARDGDALAPGAVVGALRGSLAGVLAVERTLLNFLGRLSGIATLTRRYVDAVRAAGETAEIFDTRKTTPGWRELEKYAVRVGGGRNHRFGLFDAVLMKDNHLAGVPTERLAGHLFDCLNRLETRPAFVEVEVDSLAHLEQVLKVVGIDAVLLDNFDVDGLRAAVALRDAAGLKGRVALEASGGVTLESVARIAATGVERISSGALTHAARSLDLGLDF